MSTDSERIEIEVPQGKIVVRHARCPEGCNLMDPDVKIHGHPSIHLIAELGGRKGHMHLDPVYGSYDNIAEIELGPDDVVEFYCPNCGTSLRDPDTTCAKCSAPMFMLHLPEGSFVEACQRNGCPHHRLRIVTGEQLMQRLFDATGMDSYL